MIIYILPATQIMRTVYRKIKGTLLPQRLFRAMVTTNVMQVKKKKLYHERWRWFDSTQNGLTISGKDTVGSVTRSWDIGGFRQRTGANASRIILLPPSLRMGLAPASCEIGRKSYDSQPWGGWQSGYAQSLTWHVVNNKQSIPRVWDSLLRVQPKVRSPGVQWWVQERWPWQKRETSLDIHYIHCTTDFCWLPETKKLLTESLMSLSERRSVEVR